MKFITDSVFQVSILFSVSEEIKAPPLQTGLNELSIFSTHKNIKHFAHFLKLIQVIFLFLPTTPMTFCPTGQ
jgi:hypothetical protein